MNRNLHSPTILTEFARTFEEEQETIFSKLVNRLTNNNRPSNDSPQIITVPHEGPLEGEIDQINNEPRQALAEPKQASVSSSPSITPNASTSRFYSDAGSSSSVALPDSGERTTSSVLRRLSNLISQKPNTKRSYKNTDLPKFWMPDSTSIECYDCTVKFTTFRRKHHCRLCGQIFCTKCCNQVVTGKIINCSDDLRVCNYCSKVVWSYLKSSSIAADLKPDLKALQDDLAQKLSTLHPPGSGGADLVGSNNAAVGRHPRKISVGYQEERFAASAGTGISSADRKSILQQSNSLKTLYEEMCRSLPLYNRGLELIDFLFSKQKSSNNMQAVAILNAMIDAGFLIAINELRNENMDEEATNLPTDEAQHVQQQVQQLNRTSSGGSAEDEEDNASASTEFSEDTVYKLAVFQDRLAGNSATGIASGAYHLELNFKSNSVHMRSGNDDQLSVDSEDGAGGDIAGSTTLSSINLKDSVMDSSYLISTGAKALLKVFCDHEEALVNQLLRAQNLDPSWSKTLIPIVARVANSMRLDAAYGTDAMDIRNYVYFKKVPGGERCESQILGGVVFSKNVAHKEMAQKVDKPRILLLQCAIAYQRVEGKFVSFDTLMLQERDYLRNIVSKIISLGPNIVLVHKNVAGIAQDMLRDNGITLVLDVKLCVLERIARFLDCDIISCIDSNVGKPKLGFCDRFRIQTFYDEQGSSKTLMCLEKQHSPRGCCVLLRGAKRSELAKIKKIASLLLLARHNWRFELSYLCDVYAMPPTPRASIFDSKESSPSDPPPPVTCKQIDDTCIQNEEQTTLCSKTGPIEHTTLSVRTATGNTANRENVGDWTDPLRSGTFGPSEDGNGQAGDEDDTSFELAAETPNDNRFRCALSSIILSISPFVAFPLPYLETDAGRKCALRCYFPEELYYSKQWCNDGTAGSVGERFTGTLADNSVAGTSATSKDEEEKQLLSIHPFVDYKITTSVESKEMQTILASFRACGGRYPKVSMMKKASAGRRRLTTIAQRSLDEMIYRDALDIENHQRLPVLFCSFNYNENVPSTFCAQPSYLDMQFYGQNDIMLGLFLEHYCFRSSYICKSCNLPMMDHVRRYVHSGGCIQVKLAEDLTKMDTGTILISSKCTICNEYSKQAPMSHDTWCYSFAKFLELRFHGHAYKKRNCDSVTDDSQYGEEGMVCRHSLHRDFEQNFSYKGIMASFRYTAIDIWEIVLPAMSTSLIVHMSGVNNRVITDQRTEEMKNLAIMGYDVFVKILEKLAELSVDTDTFGKLKKKANQEQVGFKQRIEKVQKLLTEDVLSVEMIDDAIVTLKHTLAEAIEEWEPKLHEIITQTKSNQASKASVVSEASNITSPVAAIDNGTIVTEELDLLHSGELQVASESCIEEVESDQKESTSISDSGKLESDLVYKEIDEDKTKENFMTEEKHPSRDNTNEKKTVKTLLSQLLSTNDYSHILSSPLPPNEHHCLKAGLFPIIVNELDLGSCIAYSLMSQEYRKMLDTMNSGGSGGVTTIGAAENSPNMKRKYASVSSTTDTEDSPSAAHNKSEQDKKHKNAAHSEIHFQDTNCNFVCKIYFAKEFDGLRCQILKNPTMAGPTHRTGAVGNTNPSQTTSCAGGNGGTSTAAEPSETSQEAMETVRKMFARSLSKSVLWEARGGKSGSKFSKTLDDRFVLKEMSRTDLTIFENFAPNYFEYLQRCIKLNHITLLAKIFGVFKITIKRKDNTSVESAVLVMENLFCGKTIDEKYDLKGSDRNRLVDPNRQTGTERVLMDENFIQMSWTNPLYILSHSKTVLKEAIIRDACFLERNEVMDYSLLVGLESSEKNLVLGIIDYIRTYTLDKKFESMIKQSGLMGGHGKLPTVVSPKMYKNRFIVAMERYFLCVPDRWEGLLKK